MTIPAAQLATAALLRRLAGSDPVETPISAVFIGGDTVWKLRKAVKLTFLDFTDVNERGRTAQRELEINAPNAPGLYRDVVPVTRSAIGVELGGSGDVVDWVVRMARVPEGDFLDVIAAKGDLTPSLLVSLADAVAEMHARLPPAERDAALALRGAIEGNYSSGLAAGLPPPRLARWRMAMLGHLEARVDWIAARGKAGFIRRSHGDLHLGNLCLWLGVPVAFDALEFSESMATVDIGYDLAFLLMDLVVRAGRPAANLVLNRYVARTGDVGLLVGLPMFLSMRALVRAHVSASGGKAWEKYFDCAEAALRPARPLALGIGGIPGTGKSTLARAVAPGLLPLPGALVLRSDEVRKRLYGLKPEERLPKSAHEEAVSRKVMGIIFEGVDQALRAGHSVIADMTFMDPSDKASLSRVAGSGRCLGVWLEAPLEVLEARVAARVGDASDAGVDVVRSAAAANAGPDGWPVLDATSPDLLDQLARLVTATASTC